MLKMPAVFSDHMVLQREKTLRLFGETDAESVTIFFLNQKYEIPVRDGKWMAELPPQSAGGPFCLKVMAGQEQLEFQDVYFGEVWLAGGQSNMEFEIMKSLGGEELLEKAKKAVASKDTERMEQVRFYQVSRISYLGEELEKAEAENCWQCYGDENMDYWSAVGFYFAREVAKKLNVMVGIIGCNWGGTSASCWMSREQLLSRENTKDYVKEYDAATEGQIEEEYLKELAHYKAYQSVFDKNVGEYYKTAENPTWEEALSLFGENLYPGPMGPRNERRPAGLYQSMLQRVQPYQVRGFLFYQAEEDDHRPYTYEDLLELLIDQWRKDWMDAELPFLYVLLPMFADVGAEDFKNWAFLREAQIRVNQKIRNTGLASAFELGEYGNIHPIKKEPVGERLADIALSRVYGSTKEIEKCGAYRYRDYVVCGNQMQLRFSKELTEAKGDTRLHIFAPDDTETERTAYVPKDMLPGFEIAGEDGNYVPAKAQLTEDMIAILLSAEELREPRFARYLWTNYEEVKIFGENGLPMEPFRTSQADGSRATGSRQGYVVEKDFSRSENKS